MRGLGRSLETCEAIAKTIYSLQLRDTGRKREPLDFYSHSTLDGRTPLPIGKGHLWLFTAVTLIRSMVPSPLMGRLNNVEHVDLI